MGKIRKALTITGVTIVVVIGIGAATLTIVDRIKNTPDLRPTKQMSTDTSTMYDPVSGTTPNVNNQTNNQPTNDSRSMLSIINDQIKSSLSKHNIASTSPKLMSVCKHTQVADENMSIMDVIVKDGKKYQCIRYDTSNIEIDIKNSNNYTEVLSSLYDIIHTAGIQSVSSEDASVLKSMKDIEPTIIYVGKPYSCMNESKDLMTAVPIYRDIDGKNLCSIYEIKASTLDNYRFNTDEKILDALIKDLGGQPYTFSDNTKIKYKYREEAVADEYKKLQEIIDAHNNPSTQNIYASNMAYVDIDDLYGEEAELETVVETPHTYSTNVRDVQHINKSFSSSSVKNYSSRMNSRPNNHTSYNTHNHSRNQ